MIIQRMILRFILTCFVASDLKDGRKIEELGRWFLADGFHIPAVFPLFSGLCRGLP